MSVDYGALMTTGMNRMKLYRRSFLTVYSLLTTNDLGYALAALSRTESMDNTNHHLGVWTYPHWLRYLRAVIYRLTPDPHRCTKRVLAAVDVWLAPGGIVDGVDPLLAYSPSLYSDPPKDGGRAAIARQIANNLCVIARAWAGLDPTGRMRAYNPQLGTASRERDHYATTKGLARECETQAMSWLTHDDLQQCALTVITETSTVAVDPDRRDAALAAMSIGHFKLAHEIATGVTLIPLPELDAEVEEEIV